MSGEGSTDDRIPVGIIGGYGIATEIDVFEERDVETPYGEPSHPPLVGEFGGERVAFLSRHGRGHEIPSSAINYRANVFSLYELGVERIVSATANGGLRDRFERGDIAVPADFIDRTKSREDSFFTDGPPHYFSPVPAFCPGLRAQIEETAERAGVRCHPNETVLIVEGPRFETPAEIVAYRQWGADVIGGSTYPEMVLARELEICYGNFALITNVSDGDTAEELGRDPVTFREIRESVGTFGDESSELLKTVVRSISPGVCDACSGHAAGARPGAHDAWEHHRG